MFKVGDKVKVIDDSHNVLVKGTLGKIFTVKNNYFSIYELDTIRTLGFSALYSEKSLTHINYKLSHWQKIETKFN